MVWSQHGLNVIARDGVLEDVLGLEDSFRSPWVWPQRSSPWPWPRSLKSSKIALSLTEDSTILSKRSKLGWKMPETLRKICSDFFFCFFGDRLKKIFEELFLFCFWRTLAPVFLILGLEQGYRNPWGMGGYIPQIF